MMKTTMIQQVTMKKATGTRGPMVIMTTASTTSDDSSTTSDDSSTTSDDSSTTSDDSSTTSDDSEHYL